MTNKADRPFSEVAAAPENANWENLLLVPQRYTTEQMM